MKVFIILFFLFVTSAQSSIFNDLPIVREFILLDMFIEKIQVIVDNISLERENCSLQERYKNELVMNCVRDKEEEFDISSKKIIIEIIDSQK